MKPAQAEQRLREVADLYEKQFLREMTKAMRSTVHESELTKADPARKLFQEQLDEQYTDRWGEKGGIGLSDLIYNQLIEKFGVQMGITPQEAKPKGPLMLNQKSEFKAHFMKSANANTQANMVFLRAMEGALLPRPVLSPWDGVLLGKKQIAGQEVLEIGHDNGLNSRLSFTGKSQDLDLGSRIQSGAQIGYLSPESDRLFWQVEAPAKSSE